MRDSARRNECGRRANGAVLRGIFLAGAKLDLQRARGLALTTKGSVSGAIFVGKTRRLRPAGGHLAFYQFKGELFTGLYVVKAGEVGFDDAEVKRWFEVASLMATRLETKY